MSCPSHGAEWLYKSSVYGIFQWDILSRKPDGKQPVESCFQIWSVKKNFLELVLWNETILWFKIWGQDISGIEPPWLDGWCGLQHEGCAWRPPAPLHVTRHVSCSLLLLLLLLLLLPALLSSLFSHHMGGSAPTRANLTPVESAAQPLVAPAFSKRRAGLRSVQPWEGTALTGN